MATVWRERVVPLFWLACACGIIAYALAGTVAHAETRGSRELGDIYAQRYAVDICMALDAQSSADGVAGVIVAIERQGFDQTAAATAVADAVFAVCPIHVNALRQFVAKYSVHRSVTA